MKSVPSKLSFYLLITGRREQEVSVHVARESNRPTYCLQETKMYDFRPSILVHIGLTN